MGFESGTLFLERDETSIPAPAVAASQRRRERAVGQAVLWALAVGLAIAAIWSWQVVGRGPLTWDEGSRVGSGVVLSFDVHAGRPLALWDWVNAQTFYPFLDPATRAIAYLFTGSIAASAWLPSLAAYGLLGVLVGQLAGALGGGRRSASLGAALCWSTPITARMAAGAFSEDLGACPLVLLVLLLVRLHNRPSTRLAAATGLVAATAFWIKYDYGILALAVVGAAATTALPRSRRSSLLAHTVAGACANVLVAGVLLFNLDRKVRDAHEFAAQSGSARRLDAAFYPRLLFDRDVGLSPLIAWLLVAGLAWAMLAMWRRAEWRVPVGAVGLWWCVYTIATPKGARIMVPVVALLAAVSAAAAADAVRLAAVRRRLTGRLVRVALGTAVVIGVGAQLPALGTRLPILDPNPPARQALAFAVAHLPVGSTSGRPALMIGPTTAFPPTVVQAAWSRLLDREAPGVPIVPEAAPADRPQVLRETIDTVKPSLILAVDPAPGSRLDTNRTERKFDSHRDYARLAAAMADEGELVPVGSAVLDGGLLRVVAYEAGPITLRGTVHVTVSPEVAGTVSIDGVDRNDFGVWREVPIGTHDVCFGLVAGYRAPPCTTMEVVAGRTAAVTGTYQPAVTADPAPGPPAGWGRLNVTATAPSPPVVVVDGLERDRAPLSLTIPPGSHEVCFAAVPPAPPPPCQPVDVPPGRAAAVAATFVAAGR